MSEYKRANSFGTDYIDMEEVYKMTITNKTKKRFFEVAGDSKVITAFGKIPEKTISYKYQKETKTTVCEGKDYFTIEIETPEHDKMMKLCDYKSYMKLIKEYSIVSEGKWKEWQQVNGKPRAVRIQE